MQLKIWHKMIIGITIPSLIAVLGGILTYGYINDIKHRQEYVQVADDLKENVFEVRRNERNFLTFKNSDYHKRVHRSIEELRQAINSISPHTSEEIGEGGFTLLNDSIDEYAKLLDALVVSYTKEQDVIRKVKSEGEKLESIVSKKRGAKEFTPSFILKLRLLEKNYMFYRDRKSYNDLGNGLSQIKNLTPFCFECDPYVNSIQDLFAVYEVSDDILGNLQNTGNELEEVSGRIAFRERQKIGSFINRSQSLLLAALALLFVLGPLFVYKTSAFVVAPIKRLSEITRKIAGGEISLRAPLKEHDETYSLSASFNTMLDHLQSTQQNLKESLELLNEKQAQLVESEKRASLGLLVAGVAHELNNPLNNISLAAEAMKEEIHESTEEEMSGYIYDILMQSKRAHNIVESLLDFARARKSTVMEKQDIIKIVNDSLYLVSNQLRINNIKLVKDLPEKPFFVKGNQSKLEQVLISMFINAIHAMKDTGTLGIKVQPDTDNRHVLIEISDTGYGIAEKDMKNIFEPFYTTKPPGEGTGLGLSVSNALVMEHKGEIDIESKPGEWTKFRIRLPQYEESGDFVADQGSLHV